MLGREDDVPLLITLDGADEAEPGGVEKRAEMPRASGPADVPAGTPPRLEEPLQDLHDAVRR